MDDNLACDLANSDISYGLYLDFRVWRRNEAEDLFNEPFEMLIDTYEGRKEERALNNSLEWVYLRDEAWNKVMAAS